MSLEQAVLANTAAIEKLTALLAGGATIPGTVPVETVAPDTKVSKDAETAKAARVKALKAEKKSEEPKAAEDPKLTYNDAAKAVVDLQKVKGTPAAKALLAKFGGKALAEIKSEKYADLIAEAQKELA
jgi:hypothetical protein